MRRWVVLSVVAALLVLATQGYRWGRIAWQVRTARACLSEGRAAEAVAALRNAEQLSPDRAEVLFLLGRALRRSGELADVDAYLTRALRAGWPEEQVRQQRYLTLLQTGDFKRTGSYLQEVLAAGAADELAAEVYEAQTKGLFASYRLQEALLCIDYWLKWRPHARQARFWRAEIRERTEGWPEAVKDYRAIVEHDPNDVEARLKLGNALLYLNDAQAALKEYQRCLQQRPDDAAARLGVAKCSRRIGSLSEAEGHLTALLESKLSPLERSQVFYELGEIAIYGRRYAQAVDYLKRAREEDPANRFVYPHLAAAYARLGQDDLAREAKERGDEALRRFSRVSELTRQMLVHPQDAEIRCETGMLFMAQGLRDEGAAWLHTALQCDANHRQSHRALADYYEELGNAASAEYHRRMADDPLAPRSAESTSQAE